MAICSVMFGFLPLCVYLLIGFWFAVTIRFICNRPCPLWGCYSMGGQSWPWGCCLWDWLQGMVLACWWAVECLVLTVWREDSKIADDITSVSKPPRRLPLMLLFPGGFPVVSCLSRRLRSASGSDPGSLKITASALGLRACEIWEAQSVSCSPSALPNSSPAGFRCWKFWGLTVPVLDPLVCRAWYRFGFLTPLGRTSATVFASHLWVICPGLWVLIHLLVSLCFYLSIMSCEEIVSARFQVLLINNYS